MWKPLSGEQSGVSQAGSASGRRGRRGRRTRRAQRIPRVRPRRPLPALGAPLCLHPGGALGARGRSSEAAAPRLAPGDALLRALVPPNPARRRRVCTAEPGRCCATATKRGQSCVPSGNCRFWDRPCVCGPRNSA